MTSALVRFPGGKYPVRKAMVKYFDRRLPYLEPFTGGASVGLEFLRQGGKDAILTDLDVSIINLWTWVRDDVQAVIRYLPEDPTVDHFREAQAVLGTTGPEAAAAKIVVLRCSMGAYGHGPIGGWEQQGKFKIDARWNYRGIQLAAWGNSLLLGGSQILLLDALEALRRWPDHQAFVDPPYVAQGPLLYDESVDHVDLARTLQERSGPFVLTIDDLTGYEGLEATNLQIAGNRGASGATKGKAGEWLVVRGRTD